MSKYNFKINGKEYNVEIKSVESGIADVCVNGTSYNVELGNTVTDSPKVEAKPQVAAPAPAQAAAAPAKTSASNGGKVITSPLPGVIISIDVKQGESVKRGQKVAVIEAMKMENEILSEADGTVSAVLAAKGDSVLEGTKIIEIA